MMQMRQNEYRCGRHWLQAVTYSYQCCCFCLTLLFTSMYYHVHASSNFTL